MRPIGGANLTQHGPGTCHDIGDAERSADLDQLAARYGHLPPQRQRVQDQQHGSRIVVDHGCRLGPGDVAQQAGHVLVPLAAPPCRQIELKGRGRGERFSSRSRGDGGNGARPRFVCSTVPVMLNTRRCEVANRRASASAAASRMSAGLCRKRPRLSPRRQLCAQRRRRRRPPEAFQQQLGRGHAQQCIE